MALLPTAIILAIVAEAAAGIPAPTIKPEDKIICKRYEVTGSLAGSRKECRTRKEWTKIDRSMQTELERMNRRGADGVPLQ